MDDEYESLDKLAGARDLRHSIDDLSKSISDLLELFRSTSEEIKGERDVDLGKKLDVLIEHQEDMAKALLLMLELMREHLPTISRHVARRKRSEGFSQERSVVPPLQARQARQEISMEIGRPKQAYQQSPIMRSQPAMTSQGAASQFLQVPPELPPLDTSLPSIQEKKKRLFGR